MDKNAERWVSLTEICEHLGFSKDTVKKLVNEQGMPAYKPDDRILIRKMIYASIMM